MPDVVYSIVNAGRCRWWVTLANITQGLSWVHMPMCLFRVGLKHLAFLEHTARMLCNMLHICAVC